MVSHVGGTIVSVVVVEVIARPSGALSVSVPNSMVVLIVLCSCTVLGDDSMYTRAARLGAGAIGHASRPV